ncbi:Bcl-2-like protein 2 [Orchesella cincta]|uniref:Bcl-2-like protein 2 n=1 Tax=Orchesella cincta TaxID=48709 RepID=A0A1D2NL57_ORCCI|nr:Bcl-2-like protein 2 [Orchesella cincta]
MARSFGKDEDEKKGNDKRAPKLEGAAGGCSCAAGDEEDGAAAVVQQPQYFPEEIRDEAAEGQHLYLDFVRTEIQRHGLEVQLPCLTISNEQPVAEIVDPARLLDWTRAGQELRQLADAFTQSKERQSVRKRAQDLSLDSLDVDNFFQLLQELFDMFLHLLLLTLSLSLGGGITRERILVLFFFCADVAIEALRKGFHQTFHQLITWSLKYIATSVAQYVHSLGGWGVVLRQSLDIAYHLTACCAFVAVVAACVVYIRRNLS